MDVFEAITTRRSIRKYKPDMIDDEKLGRVLEATRQAPSAANRQPWRFIVIKDPKIQHKIRSCYKRDWFLITKPPIIVVTCAVPCESWVKKNRKDRDYGEELFADYWKVDVAIAIQNLVLAAWAEGLGTCWIGGFNEECLRKILEIPPKMHVVAMTPLGYAAEDPEKLRLKKRKSMEEIVLYDHF